MLKSIEEQIERVRQDYLNLIVREQPDGSIQLEVPDFRLPPGWKTDKTRILVIIPVGFPTNRPNGFEANVSLRLQNDSMPTKGCGQHQINGQHWFHFCWQPQVWDHTRETLWRYLKFIEMRFAEILG